MVIDTPTAPHSLPIDAPTRPAPVRACPVCNRDNAGEPGLRWQIEPWRLRRCAMCAMVYLENPPPTEALVSDLAWEKSYTKERLNRREGRAAYYLLSDNAKRLKFALRTLKGSSREHALIARHIPGGPIVDVGCGDGRRLLDLPPSYIPHGVEISEHLAHAANLAFVARGGSCVHADAITGLARYPNDTFNGALVRSFLEHEVRPVELLRELRRALRPRARAILKVPNFACWARRLRGGSWCGFRFPDHVNYFTPATLRRAVELAGLGVVRFDIRDHTPLSDNMWIIMERPAGT